MTHANVSSPGLSPAGAREEEGEEKGESPSSEYSNTDDSHTTD